MSGEQHVRQGSSKCKGPGAGALCIWAPLFSGPLPTLAQPPGLPSPLNIFLEILIGSPWISLFPRATPPSSPRPVSLKDLGILFPLDSPSPLELETSGWHTCSSPLVLWGPWGRGSGEVPTGGTGQGCHRLRARNKGSLKAEQRSGSPGRKARQDVSLNLPQPQRGKPTQPQTERAGTLDFLPPCEGALFTDGNIKANTESG